MRLQRLNSARLASSGQVILSSSEVKQSCVLLALLLALANGEVPNCTVPTASVWRRGSESVVRLSCAFADARARRRKVEIREFTVAGHFFSSGTVQTTAIRSA